MTSPKDNLARRAARLYRDGVASTISDAISQARRLPEVGPGPSPSVEEVRRHLEALDMASEGLADWQQGQRERLEEVEQFLALLEHLLDPLEVRVAGLAARGRIMDGDRVHLRTWTGGDLRALAETLEDAGVGVPEVSSLAVRPGVAGGLPRLGTLLFVGDRVDIVLTVCPTREVALATRNLVTGGDVHLASPRQFRAVLDSLESGHAD
ncbi:MAG: hypothetical protein MK116_06845 [Phycisphaerales bacterium]|nr:hypothetical protein [Phycisphaerales bacterium]